METISGNVWHSQRARTSFLLRAGHRCGEAGQVAVKGRSCPLPCVGFGWHECGMAPPDHHASWPLPFSVSRASGLKPVSLLSHLPDWGRVWRGGRPPCCQPTACRYTTQQMLRTPAGGQIIGSTAETFHATAPNLYAQGGPGPDKARPSRTPGLPPEPAANDTVENSECSRRSFAVSAISDRMSTHKISKHRLGSAHA